MLKQNIHRNLREKKVKKYFFTGKATIKEISSYIKSQEQDIYHVSFFNGSKTKIHYHDAGQTLIVTKGSGVLEIFKKKTKGTNSFLIKKTSSTNIRMGDIAYIPPNCLHSHGASTKKLFSHIAINSFPKKNTHPKTVWCESDFKHKVTGILE